jgi:pimeloyl-ACP methyl ester carboxylesterase
MENILERVIPVFMEKNMKGEITSVLFVAANETFGDDKPTIKLTKEHGKVIYDENMLSDEPEMLGNHLRFGGYFEEIPKENREQILKEFNILAGKDSLPNPTLAMWGQQSRLRTMFAEQMRASLPKLEEEVFPLAGHPLSLSCNVEVKAIEKFFDKHLIGQ